MSATLLLVFAVLAILGVPLSVSLGLATVGALWWFDLPLSMLTQSMAQELGPEVRVNAVAPGAILWPGGDSTLDDEATQADIMRRTPLGKLGNVEDIAGAVGFLLDEAPYVSGQVLRVDGGRSTSI